MMKNFQYEFRLEDARRVSQCYELSGGFDIFRDRMVIYLDEASSIGRRPREKNKDELFEDYNLDGYLSQILYKKEFCDLQEEDKHKIERLIKESFALTEIFLTENWKQSASTWDTEISGTRYLIEYEILAVEELAKLLRIRNDFEKSEMSIKHYDKQKNIISEDAVTVDQNMYKLFLDEYIKERFKRIRYQKGPREVELFDFITSSFVLGLYINDLEKGKKTIPEEADQEFDVNKEFCRTDRPYSVRMQWECTAEYMTDLYNLMRESYPKKVRYSTKSFMFEICSSLMMLIDLAIDEENFPVNPIQKQKHLYVYYVLNYFDFALRAVIKTKEVPDEDSPSGFSVRKNKIREFFPTEGMHEEKSRFVKDALRM